MGIVAESSQNVTYSRLCSLTPCSFLVLANQSFAITNKPINVKVGPSHKVVISKIGSHFNGELTNT